MRRPALRAMIDGLGLRAISSHVAYQRFEEDVPAVIDELQALGCTLRRGSRAAAGAARHRVGAPR